MLALNKKVTKNKGKFMDEILNVIPDLFKNQIFIQAIGFIGLIIQVLSIQSKAYKKVIIMTIASEFVFGVQLFLLGAITGAVTNFGACVANFIYYLCIKNGKKTLPFQILFGIIFVGLGIFTWEGILSLLVIIAKVISTVSYGIKHTKTIRICKLISMPLWLIYDAISGSIGGAINDILVIASAIVGIIRLDKAKEHTLQDTIENSKVD